MESSAGAVAGGERGQSDNGSPGSCHGSVFVSPSAAESSVVNPSATDLEEWPPDGLISKITNQPNGFL